VANKRTVAYSPRAKADFDAIFDWIAPRSSIDVAFGYIERIRHYCEGFSTFPERGTRRDDLRPGVRTIGFERRVTIAFAVTEDRVLILRVFYGGRNVDQAFASDNDDD
jgi:toxin ParE1/3/4